MMPQQVLGFRVRLPNAVLALAKHADTFKYLQELIAMAQQTLLEKIQRHVPTVTQSQLDDALLVANLSADKVASDNALTQSIVGRLKKNVPGGMTTIAPTTPPVPMLKEEAKAKTEEVEVKMGDRDWATFNIKELSSLTDEELDSFQAYREADLKRKNKINAILGMESESLDIEAEILKTHSKVQTASRSVEGDRHAFSLASAQDSELLELAIKASESTVLDELERNRVVFEQIVNLGKQTPTYGELRLLEAQKFQRTRMNQSIRIQNTIEPEVQPRQLASADPSMITIDA